MRNKCVCNNTLLIYFYVMWLMWTISISCRYTMRFIHIDGINENDIYMYTYIILNSMSTIWETRNF